MKRIVLVILTTLIYLTAMAQSTVYFTKEITPESLMKIYHRLGHHPSGKVAVKLHFGEVGNENYLSPELVRPLVEEVNGTFIETNVYWGPRAKTESHIQVAHDHGFTYAPIDIIDADSSMMVPVVGGNHFTEAELGAGLKKYDWLISIAHFKGHAMAGFGGTFKNMAIGIASRHGKMLVHHGASGKGDFLSGEQFLENVADYSKAVIDYMKGHIIYINVLNNLSIDCDCDGHPHKAEMADIGILASDDPVALDRASVDLVKKAPNNYHLVKRIEERKGEYLLDCLEKMGVGKEQYTIVDIDKEP
jgi:uncharacterized Fe-S center protein